MKVRHFGVHSLWLLMLLLTATPLLTQCAASQSGSATETARPTLGDLAEVVFQDVYPNSEGEQELMLVLKNESYLNASLVAATIRKEVGEETEAKTLGSMLVRVTIPNGYRARPIDFAARLQPIPINGKISNATETRSPVKTLIDLLGSQREAVVRMNAALALPGTGSARALNSLEKNINDDDLWVRRCVALALARFEKSANENFQAQGAEYMNQIREAMAIVRRSAEGNKKMEGTVRRLERHLKRAGQLFPVEDEVLRLRNPETRKQMRVLMEMIQKIQTFYPYEEKTHIDALLKAAGKGLTEHLDKFSRLIDKADYRQMNESLAGQFVGIGVIVSQGTQFPIVSTPIYSGPAYKAGIRSFDRIVAVNGKSTQGYDPGKLAQLIRGEADTKVVISITRLGQDTPLDITIVRKAVTMKPVLWETLPGGIGYIRITQFGKDVPAGLDEALADLEKQDSLKGLVVDLRNNPGGEVRATVKAVSHFIGSNKLVSTLRGKAGEWKTPQEIRTPIRGKVWTDFPIVTLINGNSASGSEMFSGALRDHKRTVLVGERTYGKGIGQAPMKLTTSRGEMRLYMTVFEYYLPGGASIHKVGIMPSIEVHPEEQEEKTVLLQQELFADDTAYAYTHKLFSEFPDQARKLAQEDGHDTGSYPKFAAFYESLDTELAPEDVRRVIRNQLRNIVADERGVWFFSDVQEDRQLQRGVLELAEEMKLDLNGISRYAGIKERFKPEPEAESKIENVDDGEAAPEEADVTEETEATQEVEEAEELAPATP